MPSKNSKGTKKLVRKSSAKDANRHSSCANKKARPAKPKEMSTTASRKSRPSTSQETAFESQQKSGAKKPRPSKRTSTSHNRKAIPSVTQQSVLNSNPKYNLKKERRSVSTSPNRTSIRRSISEESAWESELDYDDRNSKSFSLSAEYEAEIPPKSFMENFLIPCLEGGDEGNLFDWMLSINLLKTPAKCISKNCNATNINLVDNLDDTKEFSWECMTCRCIMNFRVGSFFQYLTCSITDALYVILAWCRGVGATIISKQLGLDPNVVIRIYVQCLDTVESYMRTEGSQGFALGGTGSVALIDLWPGGGIRAPDLSNGNKRSHIDRFRILWIADTNHIPVRYWPILLPPTRNSDQILADLLKNTNTSNRTDVQNESSENFEFVKSKGEDGENNEEIQNYIETVEDALKGTTHTAHGKQQKQREFRVLKEQQEICDVTSTQENLKAHKMGIDCDFSHKQRNDHSILMKFQEDKILQQSQAKKRKKARRDMDELEKERYDRAKMYAKERDKYLLNRDLLETVSSLAQVHIAPGSLVIANEDAIPNICGALSASGKFEAVRSVGNILSVDDEEHTPTTSILDNIWQAASKKCAEMSVQRRIGTARTIFQIQWNQMFGADDSTRAYYILKHIASHYVSKFSNRS